MWHWLWRLSCWTCRHFCRHSRWQRDDCKDRLNSSGRKRLANRQQCIQFVDDVLSGVNGRVSQGVCGFSRRRNSSGKGFSRLLRNSEKIIFATHKNQSWTGRTRSIPDILPLALRFTKLSLSFVSYNLNEICSIAFCCDKGSVQPPEAIEVKGWPFSLGPAAQSILL